MFKFSFNNFSNTISAFNLFNFSINLNKKNAKVQLHPEESVQKEITNNEINSEITKQLYMVVRFPILVI